MTIEETPNAPNADLPVSYTQEQLDELILSSTTGLKAKVDELLGEKKKVTQASKDLEEKNRLAEEQRAKEQNDYKSLFESSQTKAQEYESKYADLNKSILSEKTNNEAIKIAGELADGPNASLLSEFIKRRIGYIDGKIVVNDAVGNPTVSTVDDLKKEFVKSGMYDSLLRQSKATGGGASGGGGDRVTTTGELSKMSRSEKLEYFKNK
jgi:hypothetical protein